MRSADGVRLAPERDVEQVSATEFRATSAEPWLRIELDGPPPPGRWVKLRYRTNLLADPVRPLLRVDRGDGEPVFLILPGPVCGAAVWVGRIPDGATGLALSPVRDPGPFACALDEMRVLSRVRLLAGAFRRRPGLTLKSMFLRLRGLKVRARHFLGAIRASTPFADYPAWLGEREAARLPEPAALVADTAAIAFRVVIAGDTNAACQGGIAQVGSRATKPGAVPPPRGEGRVAPQARTGVGGVQDMASPSRRPPPPTPPRKGEGRRETPNVGDPAQSGLDRTLASLAAQEHPSWTTDADPDATWLACLRAGDILAPHALACMAAAILRDPDLTVIYADEDRAEGGGRSAPVVRPGWSPRLHEIAGYLGGFLVIRRHTAGATDSADGAALLAAALARPNLKVGHVRRVLVHGSASSRGETCSLSHGERVGVRGVPYPERSRPSPCPSPDGRGDPRQAYPVTTSPLVSVVIPNRDSPALIRACLDGLLRRTAYPQLEIVLVDNGSTDPATLAFYATLDSDPRVTRLDRPGPFNFSALTNAGVAASRGEIVLLLNNDVEVMGPDWLDLMVAELAAPDVGAVGAKLLYPDGRLQHAGVAIGLGGGAGHLYRGCPGDTGGWLGRLAVPHEVSAVTGACLAVRRERYDVVGGLDETLFPVSYNDIDLCLKLRQRGWRNIMATGAILLHHESASRGRDVGPKAAQAAEEARRFEATWRSVMRDDPYFHPGLSLGRFDLHLG